MKRVFFSKKTAMIGIALLMLFAWSVPAAIAQPLPGGTLDPLTIPKYVTPLVIPPVMNNTGTANDYDIAVRQFQQQILPGGIWNTINGRADAFPPTTVWSYGPAADPLPDSTHWAAARDCAGTELPVQLPGLHGGEHQRHADHGGLDQRPEGKLRRRSQLPAPHAAHRPDPALGQPGCRTASTALTRTDCRGHESDSLHGPGAIIVTHVHGAHSTPESDGYPEAWYLPDPTGSNFNCVDDPAAADNVTNFVCEGTIGQPVRPHDPTRT